MIVFENDEDVFSVPLGGGGGWAVFLVEVLGVAAFVDDFLPKDFSRFAVDGDERLGAFFFLTCCEVEFFINNDGGGMAATGNGSFPADVFFGRPFGDRLGVSGGVVVFIGTAPLGPIGGESGSCE